MSVDPGIVLYSIVSFSALSFHPDRRAGHQSAIAREMEGTKIAQKARGHVSPSTIKRCLARNSDPRVQGPFDRIVRLVER